jgi:putative PIG3 family NAD(P)H quinone oxidoreductase
VSGDVAAARPLSLAAGGTITDWQEAYPRCGAGQAAYGSVRDGVLESGEASAAAGATHAIRYATTTVALSPSRRLHGPRILSTASSLYDLARSQLQLDAWRIQFDARRIVPAQTEVKFFLSIWGAGARAAPTARGSWQCHTKDLRVGFADMRAATIREGEVVIEQHPDPVPGTGEALVKVHAAGLNGADMMQRRGLYPAPSGSPQDIPGMELAGEVVALGPGAERFAVGERVMAIVGGGAQAELATVHERQLMPVPGALDWPAAGGLPEVFTTAHDALLTQAELRSGERLLVHGGAGGVGSAAIQLARAVGAHVTATVRSEPLREQVAALGAEAIAPEGFSDHGPFDVILELVGAPNLAENLQALATGGRITVIGVSAGAKGELNLLALMGKRARIHGSTLRARPLEEKALSARRLEHEVLPLFEARPPALRVPIADTFPLEQAAAAYDRFAAGGKLGKIVLTV